MAYYRIYVKLKSLWTCSHITFSSSIRVLGKLLLCNKSLKVNNSKPTLVMDYFLNCTLPSMYLHVCERNLQRYLKKLRTCSRNLRFW